MIGLLPTKFICINCGEPTILKKISSTETIEFIGVDICKCKGDPAFTVKRESNIVSFALEKEKRIKPKQEKK